MRISLIVPCLNEEQAIPIFKQTLDAVFATELPTYEKELIFIDDGSTDNTLQIIKELATNSPDVKFISFSRNFGKEAAIYAGLEAATGDYTAVMDVDLQDPPSLLPEMIRAIEEEGYDCAGTCRVSRSGEPPIRSFFARSFYKLINKISKTQIVDGARDYKLMTRPVVNALISLKEYNRFSKGLYEWVGFRTKWFKYENIERVAGETKWSFFKLFLYSIEGIVAFSTAPLALASIMGVLLSGFSFLSIVILVIRELIWHHSAYGWTSMVCIFCLMGGIILLCLGILGQYLARTYTEVKKRPIYISKERSI
ncbi:MAG: glycosyltransferase family 2 protein [Akkermansia sp.]|nr:glycosyltransferase family 2 protein [Akkermansia sp.]